MFIRSFALSCALGLCVTQAAVAGACGGQNLFETMPTEQRARLESAAQAVPFAEGNFWQAEKDGKSVLLVGTYHLDDPRHDATMRALGPHLKAAQEILVEARPEEEAQLQKAIANDPSLIVMADQSLPDLLPPQDWAQLSQALGERGLPGPIAAKMKPWYISVLLALPPCLVADLATQRGLDHRIIDFATEHAIPTTALEAFDTVFKSFGAVSTEEQLAMVRSSLAMEPQAEDYLVTLSDAYFKGQSRLVWELSRELALAVPGYTPERVEADLALMETHLMTKRNEAWIPVIEAAAARGPVVAAFGALHLPGETGVPQLLQQAGWQLQPITLTQP